MSRQASARRGPCAQQCAQSKVFVGNDRQHGQAQSSPFRRLRAKSCAGCTHHDDRSKMGQIMQPYRIDNQLDNKMGAGVWGYRPRNDRTTLKNRRSSGRSPPDLYNAEA